MYKDTIFFVELQKSLYICEDKRGLNMKNQILLLASTFAERGGWVDDRQFFDLVGSTYLLAHGLGEPVADAKTTFVVEQSGTYNLFVRTRNWTAYWSDAPTPGIFEVFVDGMSAGVFGNQNSEWHWQRGIAINLEAGEHKVVVHDLTGFDARFDALLLTTSDIAPKEGVEEYRQLRKRLLALPSAPVSRGSYDFVVVGGGVAGVPPSLQLVQARAWHLFRIGRCWAVITRPKFA